MFIKEHCFIVKYSIENIGVQNENQESQELLDSLCLQNCVFQEENVSKNTTIKIFAENQAAINQASNKIKNATDQNINP